MKTAQFLVWILLFCLITSFNIFIFLNNINDCTNFNSSSENWLYDEEKATIYFITPTYARHVQKAELTRISHTLLLIKNINWIIVEDNVGKSSLVKNFITQTDSRKIYKSFNITHLFASTPQTFKTKETDPNWLKPRGVWQRNKALTWLRQNIDSLNPNGVVYFGDDDNTYDLKLFEEIRNTNKVSVFPVGLVGGLLVEKPLVKNNKVIGFNSMWKPNRKYPIDMSGFAVNLDLIIRKSEALFSSSVARGYQETHLINQLIDSTDELEPKANQCQQILVWHTRTEAPKLKQELKLLTPSNYGME